MFDMRSLRLRGGWFRLWVVASTLWIALFVVSSVREGALLAFPTDYLAYIPECPPARIADFALRELRDMNRPVNSCLDRIIASDRERSLSERSYQQCEAEFREQSAHYHEQSRLAEQRRIEIERARPQRSHGATCLDAIERSHATAGYGFFREPTFNPMPETEDLSLPAIAAAKSALLSVQVNWALSAFAMMCWGLGLVPAALNLGLAIAILIVSWVLRGFRSNV